MSDHGWRYRQAHRRERGWDLLILVLAIFVILTWIAWGFPTGLPA